MSSGGFELFIDGASHFSNSQTHEQECLPGSNDSWVLRMRPPVSFEALVSQFNKRLFERIGAWPAEQRVDVFARMLYACFSDHGPSPGLFFPQLGVFSAEVAMHTTVNDGKGFSLGLE